MKLNAAEIASVDHGAFSAEWLSCLCLSSAFQQELPSFTHAAWLLSAFALEREKDNNSCNSLLKKLQGRLYPPKQPMHRHNYVFICYWGAMSSPGSAIPTLLHYFLDNRRFFFLFLAPFHLLSFILQTDSSSFKKTWEKFLSYWVTL